MTKQEIIDYVMTTPSNPNKAVLEGMLDSITGASEEMIILTEENVTTQVRPNPITGEDSPCAAEKLAYSELIDADTIQVTFEGKQYTCQKRSSSQPNTYEYGASIASESVDFSQFPFGILSSVSPFSPDTINNALYTETAGTYQIKIEVPQEDGSSANDWSTAQISFSNDSNYYYYIDLAYLNSKNQLTSDRITVPGTDESTSEIVVGYTVPLYKNQYFLPNKAIDRTDKNYQVISGRITDTGRGLLIEGDGTIKLRGNTGK